ncbi:phosphoinositide 3-kinase adapter protein 1 isoform X4 [Patella vulgata]|uniref:phosphoinositide 3-kinase adapter protein 1 isoform X4 n=1 Tax=Patella vulgata TaxID=6465 RepID=UPI00217F9238|nr:phosphoinositide 3-kinase adapter protein 1 isoform X4 [Patella vulgata]
MGEVLLFYASDGEQWATFLTNKFTSQEYNLPVRTELFSTPDFEFSAECCVQVLLLTPELLESASKTKTNFLGLIPTRCVVVLLGVEKSDVETLLKADGQSKHIFDCKICCVNNDNETIKGTLVTIIEVYEGCGSDDDDDIYSVPPSNKQINHVYQVIPDHIQQGDYIYVILDRKAENGVQIHCDSTDEGIVIDSLDKAVYCAKLPESAKGELNLSIVSDNQPLGEEKIVVETKLDRMRSLLDDVVNPVGFLCQALGLRTYTAKALDEALVQKIRLKSSPSVFQAFLSIDDVNFTDDKSKSIWPTPLHFAAEYNLEQFVQELMKYPGMILAACTENINKEYPSTIAEREGHTDLCHKLVRFVLDQKQEAVSRLRGESPCNSPQLNRSKLRHLKDSSCSSIPDPFPCLMKRGPAPLLPEKSIDRCSLTSDLTDSPRNTYYEDDDTDSIYNIPPPASPIVKHRSSSEFKDDSLIEKATTAETVSAQSPVQVEITQPSPTLPRPQTMCIADINFDSPDSASSSSRLSVDSDSGSHEMRGDKPSRRSLQSKISSFVRKLRPRFGSTSELPKVDKARKKTKFYTKSDPGFGDQAVGLAILDKINQDKDKASGEQERDSGSFSEEEDEKTPRNSYIKKENKKTRKGDKNSGLIRKKSVRVTRALTDSATDAPSVPLKVFPEV